jgi:hypothetical protein
MPNVTRMRRGVAVASGMPGLIEASYTCSHGATPSYVYLTVHPADFSRIPWVTDVYFNDTVNTLRVPDCRIVDATEMMSGSGLIVRFAMQDHRWRWLHGSINGEYNLPAVRLRYVPRVPSLQLQQGNPPAGFLQEFPDQFTQQIQEWTKKSARELGRLLAEKMGEPVDVSSLPDNQFPHVVWQGHNPARELQSLAEAYGCRLVYDPFNNRTMVARLGFGSALPDGFPGEIQSDEYGFDPPEPPVAIVIYGGPMLVQARMKCEPVMMDFDGRFKYVDSVSMKPANRWEYFGPDGLFALSGIKRGDDDYNRLWPKGLPGSRKGNDVFNLATSYLYKAFRPMYTLPHRGDDQFWFPVTSIEPRQKYSRHDVILTDHTVEVTVDDIGTTVLLGGRAFGRTLRGGVGIFEETDDFEEINIPFAVIPEHQVVVFHQPLYYDDFLFDADGALVMTDEDQPAHGFNFTFPVIEVAVMLRDPVTHAPVRYRKSFPMAPRPPRRQRANPVVPPFGPVPPPPDVPLSAQSGPGRPGEEVFTFDEIRLGVHTSYGQQHDHLQTRANFGEADRKAEFFKNAVAVKYQLVEPHTRTYNGIRPALLDGSVQQVSVKVVAGRAGTTTTMSRNTEHAPLVDPYGVRRTQEELSLEAIKRIKMAVRKFDHLGMPRFD